MKRVFWFHYNKPASRSYGIPKMTIHYKGTCHIVDHIQCNVNVATYHRKSQPHVVLKGYTSKFEIKTVNNLIVVHIE
jgi:hypothetical protein